MTDLERLNRKLAKFKTGDDAPEQTVAGGTDGIVSALLSEIEETILPREMVLTDENGTEFRLLVAGRRLLRVDGGNAAAPDSDDPADAVAAAFAGPLRSFLDQAGEISVAADRPRDRLDPTEIGCSVEALVAAAAQPPATPAADADPVSACLALCRAGLRLDADGGAETPVGDPDLVMRLQHFAEAALPTLAPPATRAMPRLTILRAARADDLVLAHVAARDGAALFLAPAEAQADLLSICRNAVPA
ncbi:hypothetical protein SAMN05444722_1939 [Rhodovulum sp. ES.010]|uniref:hypothetical protein n=1 Tax=Rhodovulum sp. ES.010 TaxID=1882821 RepID=UPI00092AFD12|nr:hypothetical protein [Rhodovulum sp. ES.010]SIO40659.1 hypothetical protein SAMN05444722_1939 [Rhodovulum sp. ES.010]